MTLNQEHTDKVRARGFSDAQIQRLAHSNGSPPLIESLTAEQIQSDWLHRFPAMRGNDGGALLLRFNDCTVSLKPDKPVWDAEKQKAKKYLYEFCPEHLPKGSKTQPWIPKGAASCATEGLFDALAITLLMETPCAAVTAPSHIKRSVFPESVKVYVSDSDVPFHHSGGLLPTVVGHCRSKGLKLAHFPRNPNADYAYEGDKIPNDCKWGGEEWAAHWKNEGNDPKAEMAKVIASAKAPFEYIKGIIREFADVGIRYPANSIVISNCAKAIADATDDPTKRHVLRDLLADATKAGKKWIENQIRERSAKLLHDRAKEREELYEQGLEERPEELPGDPYEISEGDCIDTHITDMLLAQEQLYGASNGALFTYDADRGYWHRMRHDEALQMIQAEVRQVYRFRRDGSKAYPYGTAAQVQSCLSSLLTRTTDARLSELPRHIPFLDQTYNCNDGTVVPHSPDHGATYGVNADLQLIDECPAVFAAFVDTCYGKEVLPVIRAWVRAIIDPSIPYGKYLFIVGMSGTGKGILLEFFDTLLPATCRSSLEEPGDIHNADKVYQLVLGKRYIGFHDLPPRLKTMQLFYKIVENVEVSARKLNSSHTVEVQPNCRFAMAATKMPTVADGNDGLVRRAIVIRTKPRNGKCDINLKGQLVGTSAEHQQLRADVMGWALQMPRQECIDILYGDAAADVLDEGITELEANADVVARFVDRCMLPNGNKEVTQQDWDKLYQVYRLFCQEFGYDGKGSIGLFMNRMRAKMPHLHRKRRKESVADARAAGRDIASRANLPACDWGFTCRDGLRVSSKFSDKYTFDSTKCGADGLEMLREHRPFCPQDER